MSRIEDVFISKKKALIAYVTLGYPDVEATIKVVPLLAENGCDIIELGIPFSDPLADGVTIQNASFKALQNGVTTKLCLETAGKLSREVRTPLVFMTYFNPIMNYGLDRFCSDCQSAGVSGLIIPDLPPEEGAELDTCSRCQNVDVIYLLAPNSTTERIKLVAGRSRGFIYLVSLTGVTGARSNLSTDLGEFIARVRQYARQPLSVGFGISTPEQAAQVARTADGVIIGSKILQLMDADPSLNTVKDFIREVRKAMDKL